MLVSGLKSGRRSSWALSATTTVDANMRIAPMLMGSTNPIGAGQDHSGRSDRNIGARSDGYPDMGLGKCGCVVDAVADHGDLAALDLELRNFQGLILGVHPGENPVDPELSSKSSGHGLSITGDHGHLNAMSVHSFNGHARLGADLISKAQGAHDVTVNEGVEDDRALIPPLR